MGLCLIVFKLVYLSKTFIIVTIYVLAAPRVLSFKHRYMDSINGETVHRTEVNRIFSNLSRPADLHDAVNQSGAARPGMPAVNRMASDVHHK